MALALQAYSSARPFPKRKIRHEKLGGGLKRLASAFRFGKLFLVIRG